MSWLPGGLLSTCTLCPAPLPAYHNRDAHLQPSPPSVLPQVERLQRKFAMIHSTLAQQQSNHKADGVDTPKLRHRWGVQLAAVIPWEQTAAAALGCVPVPFCNWKAAMAARCCSCTAPLLMLARHHVPPCSEENPLNGLSRSGALPPGAAAAAKVGWACGVCSSSSSCRC